MQDREPFTFDKQFTTPGGHGYFRCSAGERKGQWALADASGVFPWSADDGNLWVIEQVIEVGESDCTLMLSGPDGLTQTPISPAEAVIVAGTLGLQMQVSWPASARLYGVNDLGLATATELQVTHPDGTRVSVNEWIRDAEGGYARFVAAERVEGQIVLTVLAGGPETSTAPAAMYDLRVE